VKDLLIEARDLAAEKMPAAGQLLQDDPGRVICDLAVSGSQR
jgi:hypothetical protein